MADLIFPPSLLPTRVTWTLQRNVATYTSPLSYASQRNDVNRSARWRATIEMPPLAADEAALLSTWLDQISRGEHAGLVPVHQNTISGTEGATAAFSSRQLPWSDPASLTGWVSFNLTNPARIVDGQVFLFANATPPGYILRNFAVVAGAYYEVTLDVPLQTGNVRILIDDGATVLVNPGPSMVYGRRTFIVSPTTTSLQVYLFAGGDAEAFAQAFYGNLKVARVMTVWQATTAGTRSFGTWGGLNADFDNFKAGQFVNVLSSRGVELKRVQRAVRQVPSANNNGLAVNFIGVTTFEPSLRGGVGVNALISHIDPVCRMRLATPESTAVVDAPNFSGFTFDLIEDIAP